MGISKPFLTVLVLLSVAFGVVLGIVMGYIRDLPQVDRLQKYRPETVTRILDQDGRPIGELFKMRRILVDLEDVPPHLINAVISSEDSGFFKHSGVYYPGILRALWTDLRTLKKAQGASTITQQLARLLFLSPDKRVSRKIREAILAMVIEKRFTKNEILEMYLNQIYLGSGAYGVEAASHIYFGKSVSKLNLAECALIAGLPQAPNRYSPLRNPDKALQRRKTVLHRMKVEGYISTQEEEWGNDQPIRLNPELNPQDAPYFVESVRLYLEDRFGPSKVYNDGLTVKTTLNLDWQRLANQAVQLGVVEVNQKIRQFRGEKEVGDGPDKEEGVQSALVAIDPKTGGIRAMVGGTDFFISQFNRVTQAERQPGSAFKPFIYITALENGYTPSDRLVDSPIVITDPSRRGYWKPTNYSERFYGPVSLRFALENSLNVATIKLLQKVGIPNVKDTAERMGILSPLQPYLSLALGGSEVNLLELTSAYGILADRGIHQEPTMIESILDRGGRVLEEGRQDPTDVLSPETAFIMTKMLQGVVTDGTGKVALDVGRPVAAKTGTTDQFHDAWFIGFSPELATGVWVGFDDPASMTRIATGGMAAGPIWTEFMKNALADLPVSDFIQPENVVEVLIDADSGLLATGKCKNVISEYYLEGTQPHKTCTLETKNPSPGLL